MKPTNIVFAAAAAFAVGGPGAAGAQEIDLQNGATIPLAETGALAEIEEPLRSAGADLESVLPAAMETATLDGVLYGLPFQAEAHALIYNKGLFEAAGLDPEAPPETWDEFVAAAKTLTGDIDGRQVYGYGVSGGGADQPGNTLFRSLPFLWMNGGGILDADQQTVILDSPASIEGVEFYTGLYTEEGVSPPSTLENDSSALRRLFTVGTLAMIPGATSDVARIVEAAPDIDIGVGLMPHPEGKDPAVILGGWNFVIPAASENVDVAARLAAFVSQPERAAIYTTTFPANQEALSNERFSDPIMDAHKEMLAYARPQPSIAEWSQIGQIYYDNIQEILLGSDPTETMTLAAEQIRGVLGK